MQVGRFEGEVMGGVKAQEEEGGLPRWRGVKAWRGHERV